MAYQVLARKLRPQTFDEVIGQSAITQSLVNALRLDRLGHAFLFAGSRGIGKTTTARILAKALNCEKGPTPEPCNICRHCREITAGSSMDVIEIDGASNRGIDEIRELRENVRYSPVNARCKVIIIDEVHMLTREAFNALLKTLEEPPDHVKFILATTEAHKVPVTILSRCQRYDFRRLDVATLTGFLMEICRKENVSAEERTLEVLARMADGGIRDCLSLLDQVISFSGTAIDHRRTMELLGRIDPELMLDVFRSLASGEGAVALTKFAGYIDGGGDETIFNREMMEILRDLLAVKMRAAPRTPVPEDVAEAFTFDQLERMFKITLELEQSFRYTEFPRLLMDVALVKMARIQALTPLAEILGRLRNMSLHPENPALAISTRTTAPGRNPVAPVTPPKLPAPISRKETPPKIPPQRPAPAKTEPAGTPAGGEHAGKANHREPDTSGDSTGDSAGTLDGGDPQPQPTTTGPEPDRTPRIATGKRPETDNSTLHKLINCLPANAAPLRSLLAFAAVESVNDESVTLVFHPDYRMQFDLFTNYEHREELLQTAAPEAFERPVRILFRMGDSDSPLSLQEQEAASNHRIRDEQWQTAREHPLVQKSLRMFQGAIRDVKAKTRHSSAEPWFARREGGTVEDDADDQ